MEVGGDGGRERPAVEVGVVRPSGVKRRRWRREEAAGRGSRSAEQGVRVSAGPFIHIGIHSNRRIGDGRMVNIGP